MLQTLTIASSLPANKNLPSVEIHPLIRWLKLRDPIYRVVIVSLFQRKERNEMSYFSISISNDLMIYLKMSTIRCTPSLQNKINLLSLGQHWISLIAIFIISFIFIFLYGCQDRLRSSCLSAIKLPREQPEKSSNSFFYRFEKRKKKMIEMVQIISLFA